MLRKIIIFSVCAGTSASFPTLYQSHQETIHRLVAPFIGASAPEVRLSAVQTSSLGSGRQVRLAADPTGHFSGEFRLNGQRVEGMVDTGATVVALNRSTARRIGILPAQMDFVQKVDTANGLAHAALVTIDRLQIGQISVNNVQAAVLDDSALSGTLIGMSFLNRLGKYQVENSTLLMVQ